MLYFLRRFYSMSKTNRVNKKNIQLATVGVIATVLFIMGIYIDTVHGEGMAKSMIINLFTGESNAKEASMVQSDSISFENGMEYEAVTFGSSFALATKDGVKYYNEVGDQRWSDTYNMVSPKMIYEGNWIVIGDLSGNTLRVYNNTGFKFEIQGKGTILQFALNENGFVSLITQENNRFGVYIYSNQGVLIKERVEENIGVYPLSSDISSDNRSFAVSYIDTTDLVPVARILFFYINQQDSQEYTDSIFSASVQKDDEIIPKINYLKGDVLGVVSDKGVYGINTDGLEQWSFPLGNAVDQCDMSNKDYIVLALGSERASAMINPDATSYDKNTVIWIDTSGRVKGEYTNSEAVGYINSHTSGIVIGNNNNFVGITHNGKISWEYKSTTDIYDFMPMLTIREVMLLTKQEAVILQMDRVGQGIIEPIIRIENTGTIIEEDDGYGEVEKDVSVDFEKPVIEEENEDVEEIEEDEILVDEEVVD